MNIGPVQRQSLLTFGSLLSVTAVGYLATFYFAHTLGPAILGSFYLFLAYYGIFDLIGDGGFGGAVVKRISEGREQNEYFTAYFVLRIMLCCISILVIFIISPFIPKLAENGLLYWLILSVLVGTFFSITGGDLWGTAKVGIMQLSNLLNALVKSCIQILAILAGFGLGGLIAGFVAGMIASTVVNLRYVSLSISRFNFSHVKGLLSFSIWTFMSSGGFLVFTYADTVLIGYFMTETDIGIYRVALQLSSVASFLVLAFHTVLYPRISKWNAENNKTLIEFALARAFSYSLLLAIPITVGGILLSDRLLYYLYGAAFSSGSEVLIILLFVQIANIFLYLQTMCLNAIDKPKESFTITIISAILNIILNILLIPVLGIAGAAVASLLTMSGNAILAYLILRSYVQIRIEKMPVFHFLVSAMVMAIFLWIFLHLIEISGFFILILLISCGAILYFATVLWIDVSMRSDLNYVLNTINFPINLQ